MWTLCMIDQDANIHEQAGRWDKTDCNSLENRDRWTGLNWLDSVKDLVNYLSLCAFGVWFWFTNCHWLHHGL